jgi:lambda family phage portal protein
VSIIGRLIEGVRAIGRSHAATPGGRRAPLSRQVRVRARYDAAQTTPDNHRHWLLADGLSADAAASPAVRRTLRNRARYEVANNSYARGIVLTLANDCVGTGPRLQLMSVGGDEARVIERSFIDWAHTIDLAEKLRCMRVAMAEDGEAFALLTSNPALASPVQLDLTLIEADQVATPTTVPLPRHAVDGIVFDAVANPVEYHVLKEHPGSPFGAWRLDYDRVPAASMIHLFRPDRPGQRRGVPEITPAIPLFSQLRRYTLAVIAAAETAADYAGIVYTDAPAGGEADQVEPMDTIELEKRALLTMPGGWKMEQMRAEQPATTYAEFKHEILNEIARCLNMPFNIAAGNSSGYNYASGRLDHQTYYKAMRVDQARLALQVLDRVFAAWTREALLIDGFLPQRLRTVATDWSHQWFWDGHEHVDPAKEANAQATRLAHNTTTLADEFARKGQDWEVQLRQRARELALMRELGIGLTPASDSPTQPPAAPTPAADPTDAPIPDAGDEIDAHAA